MSTSSSSRSLILSCLLGLAAFSADAQQTLIVNPGQSIQTAINQAVAGDTVQVRPGTYTQKVSIANKSGTSNAFITLKADPGAIIDGTGLAPVSRQGLITISNSNYIRVEGFEIRNFFYSGQDNTPVGILVEGSGTQLKILNNRVHDIRNNSTCTDPCPSGAHGVGVFGTSATGITDLLLSGNEVYNNVLQSSEAFVINGNVDRFEVLNNNVHDNNNIGFDFIGYEGECSGCGENDRVRNGIVRGNTATNNSSTSNPWYGGEGSAAGFYVDGGRYLVFDRNVSSGNDLGFEFASEHAGKATEDIVVMNNFVYNNREVGIGLGGYASNLGESRRIHVYNNSFYKNLGWGTEVVFQYKVKNSNFAGNIFFGEASAGESYANYGSGHTGNTWGKNIWWGTSTTSTGLPGTKVIANPLFVAPATGNLRLQSTSPAINAGVVAANITTWTSTIWDVYFPTQGNIPPNGLLDINGESRVEGVIDLGADEYGTGGGPALPPAAPSGLNAVANSSSQITLSWVDNANNESGFKLERSLTSGSGFSQIATPAANVISHPNTGLTASTQYFYRIRATNAAGDSAYSNEASATTQAGSSVVITVDGNTADWAAVPTISTSGVGGLTSLKAFANATYLYILAQGTTSTNYAIFINKDSASTGFTSGLWASEGSDYSLENGTLFRYNGTGTNWSWTTSGVTQTGIQAVKNASAIEVRIPRASIAGMGSTIRIGVDSEDANWNNVASIPAQGTVQAPFTP